MNPNYVYRGLMVVVLIGISYLAASAQSRYFIYLPLIHVAPVTVATATPTATPVPPTVTPAPTPTPTATPDLRRSDSGDEKSECNIFGCTLIIYYEINQGNCIGPFTIDESQSTFTVGSTTLTWSEFERTYGFPIYDDERHHILEAHSLKVYITSLAAEMQPPFFDPSIYMVVGYCSLTR